MSSACSRRSLLAPKTVSCLSFPEFLTTKRTVWHDSAYVSVSASDHSRGARNEVFFNT